MARESSSAADPVADSLLASIEVDVAQSVPTKGKEVTYGRAGYLCITDGDWSAPLVAVPTPGGAAAGVWGDARLTGGAASLVDAARHSPPAQEDLSRRESPPATTWCAEICGVHRLGRVYCHCAPAVDYDGTRDHCRHALDIVDDLGDTQKHKQRQNSSYFVSQTATGGKV